MIYFLKILLLSSLLLPVAAVAEDMADAQRGKIVAAVRCGPCHHLQSADVKVGPSLLNIYNHKPTITGVPFTVWDTDSLQVWLMNPRQIKANTTMLLPPISKRDRNDIIAWLKASVGNEEE